MAVDDDDTVIGFTHVLDLEGHWHLEQIAVDPAHGRRGIGSALLEATHRELVRRGAPEVTLMTYADVPWNAPFYARHGYVELDPLPAYLVPLRENEARFDLARHGRRVAMVATSPAADARTWVRSAAWAKDFTHVRGQTAAAKTTSGHGELASQRRRASASASFGGKSGCPLGTAGEAPRAPVGASAHSAPRGSVVAVVCTVGLLRGAVRVRCPSPLHHVMFGQA